MNHTRKLFTFDWAIKRLLRSKANFGILEGFLSELLKEEITILDLLESESNKEDNLDKFNRVDLRVRNQKQEIIIPTRTKSCCQRFFALDMFTETLDALRQSEQAFGVAFNRLYGGISSLTCTQIVDNLKVG